MHVKFNVSKICKIRKSKNVNSHVFVVVQEKYYNYNLVDRII